MRTLIGAPLVLSTDNEPRPVANTFAAKIHRIAHK